MAEPTIVQEQRAVVRAVQRVADELLHEEEAVNTRLKLDRESAEQAMAQARHAADAELKRALEMHQEAERLVQPRIDAALLGKIVPAPPPKLFDADVLVGLRLATAQIESRLIRIRASFGDETSSTLITAGIILGAIVAVGAIFLMPFAANLNLGGPTWSLGWFAAMVSPFLLALVVAAGRATIFRPYSPSDDYAFIRETMTHVLYLHQILTEEARTTYERRLSERQQRFDETKERIVQGFRQQLALLEPVVAKFSTIASAVGPEWSAPAWDEWTPSTAMPHTICIGDMLAGVREDRLACPALVPFPHERAVIFKTDAQAHDRAVAAIQSILLRLVATVPRGDLRLILIDPLGQGQNVADFLPLADVGIGLGEGRAWTEPHQIEQRLTDLVNVVESAADTAAPHPARSRPAARVHTMSEPCRILVVLDFPTNFGGNTARLLATLIQKGPARGIHPLLLVDTGQPAPYGFNLTGLEFGATVIEWDGRRFVWRDEDFGQCWLELDHPPPRPLVKRLLKGVLAPVSSGRRRVLARSN
ncbi:MAG: hypothetical protein IT305_12040 [Chloroflexi bacterium]|nr:hypothetical protein [Chloroflexota bacterium]